VRPRANRKEIVKWGRFQSLNIFCWPSVTSRLAAPPAAEHIAAAVEAGATQAEAAAKVGKSQPWVNRLLKWRAGGFKDGGPFAEDHARAIISVARAFS
jgi:hypothetical protein